MDIGSHYIPKTNKKSLSCQGEDAHFISSNSKTFGIADGVGGWKKLGIDSGEYSRQLMKNAHDSLSMSSSTAADVDPVTVLKEAFLKTKVKGSSTACIVTIKEDYNLYAVNVGDSGFVQIRDGKIIYTSPIQEHYFNCPYQLSYYNNQNNGLSSAENIKRVIEPGDIIVAGTDGFFDNVNEEEIENLIRISMQYGRATPPNVLAGMMAVLALHNAKDTGARTPYMQRRRLAGETEAVGGKYDDITVVVAYIMPLRLKRKKNFISRTKRIFGIGKSSWSARLLIVALLLVEKSQRIWNVLY